MAFTFSESVTMQMPDLGDRVSSVGESVVRNSKGIVVELAAIHEGMTQNFTNYSADELREALPSWVQPFGRPIIKNHDVHEESLGRVIAARMDREPTGEEFIMIQAAITDVQAIEKYLDERYLTGSIGGKAEKALCSICEADWAERMFACEHERGKTYKGKIAFLNMEGIKFREYSVVNTPADEGSTVRKIHADGQPMADEHDGWVRAARVFAIDMDTPKITEFAESADIDVLEQLSKPEASSVYMQLKTAFLSTLSMPKEFDVDDNDNEQTEDVLAVAEGLSSDLADLSATEAEEEAPADEDEEAPAAPESEEQESTTDTEETESEAPVATEDAEEASEEDEDEDEEPESENADEAEESDNSDGELNEEASLEPRVEELENDNAALSAEVESLKAENTQLKERETRLTAVIRQHLAESVVDMKIARGIIEAEDRGTELTNHLTRSSASLADSRRDLAAMTSVTPPITQAPKVEEQSAVLDEQEGTGVDVNESTVTTPKDKEERIVNFLTNTLLNRSTTL